MWRRNVAYLRCLAHTDVKAIPPPPFPLTHLSLHHSAFCLFLLSLCACAENPHSPIHPSSLPLVSAAPGRRVWHDRVSDDSETDSPTPSSPDLLSGATTSDSESAGDPSADDDSGSASDGSGAGKGDQEIEDATASANDTDANNASASTDTEQSGLDAGHPVGDAGVASHDLGGTGAATAQVEVAATCAAPATRPDDVSSGKAVTPELLADVTARVSRIVVDDDDSDTDGQAEAGEAKSDDRKAIGKSGRTTAPTRAQLAEEPPGSSTKHGDRGAVRAEVKEVPAKARRRQEQRQSQAAEIAATAAASAATATTPDVRRTRRLSGRALVRPALSQPTSPLSSSPGASPSPEHSSEGDGSAGPGVVSVMDDVSDGDYSDGGINTSRPKRLACPSPKPAARRQARHRSPA